MRNIAAKNQHQTSMKPTLQMPLK